MMKKTEFSFQGSGGQLFLVLLKNLLLTVVTIGLYSFKAKVNRRQFFWRNTFWRGHAFDFSGTVSDQLRGMVWLACVVGGALLIGVVLAVAAHPVLALPFFYAGMMVIGLRIRFGGFRYRMRNTIYRGVRGNVSQDAFIPYLKEGLACIFLNIVTLGIYSPFATVRMAKARWNQASWGQLKFSFRGEGKEYFWIAFKGMLLTILTLGMYAPWYVAARYRFIAKSIHLAEDHFELEVSGFDLFKMFLAFSFFTVITLGVAIPWLAVSMLEMVYARLEFKGQINFDSVLAEADAKRKLAGDAAGDSFDSDFDVAM
jgi:uncharacterized membrane protein YjgN (DUF898 family)